MHPEKWCIRFSQLLLYRYDLCSERCQRQFCDLEELLPEGDPNNGDAPEQADHQISKRHGDSKENEPDDVGQSGEHQSSPDASQASPLKNPPNTNHSILPKKLIVSPSIFRNDKCRFGSQSIPPAPVWVKTPLIPSASPFGQMFFLPLTLKEVMPQSSSLPTRPSKKEINLC